MKLNGNNFSRLFSSVLAWNLHLKYTVARVSTIIEREKSKFEMQIYGQQGKMCAFVYFLCWKLRDRRTAKSFYDFLLHRHFPLFFTHTSIFSTNCEFTPSVYLHKVYSYLFFPFLKWWIKLPWRYFLRPSILFQILYARKNGFVFYSNPFLLV